MPNARLCILFICTMRPVSSDWGKWMVQHKIHSTVNNTGCDPHCQSSQSKNLSYIIYNCVHQWPWTNEMLYHYYFVRSSNFEHISFHRAIFFLFHFIWMVFYFWFGLVSAFGDERCCHILIYLCKCILPLVVSPVRTNYVHKYYIRLFGIAYRTSFPTLKIHR